MLKLAITYQNQPEMVMVNGQFFPINPSQFKNDFNMKIKVGLGTGTKEQQSARVMGLLQVMGQGAQMGVVKPENIAEAIKMVALIEQVALRVAVLVMVVTKQMLDKIVRRIARQFSIGAGE